MDQDYIEFNNLEFEQENRKFLKKKRLKDDKMFQETNDFSNSISINSNNNYFQCSNKSDGFSSDFSEEKYTDKNENMDLSLEKFKNIMNSDEKYSNKEESISENGLYIIQNNPTIIKNNNNNINKKETKYTQNNIKNKKIKISDEDYLKYGKRKYQKDNVSQKLFKNFNDWIINIIENKIPNSLRKKIFPPDYDIFTHNTNYKDIRFFLDTQYKNILIMTKKDKENLDKLLILKGIKKQRKYNETTLNDKEFKDAEILLRKFKKIEENEKIEDNKIIIFIIDILIEKGYKKADEEKIFFKKDKDNFNQLLVEYKIKKYFKNQEKNENLIEDIEKIKTIEELKMTLRELLLKFFESKSKEFENFKMEVKENNKYYESLYGFNLLILNESKTSCGFIDMIERNCDIPNNKIKTLNHITNYFINKKINKNEIDKYIELYPEKNIDN